MQVTSVTSDHTKLRSQAGIKGPRNTGDRTTTILLFNLVSKQEWYLYTLLDFTLLLTWRE